MNKILPDGSYVLVEPCEGIDATDGLYVVWAGGEKAVVRRVFLHDNGLTLACESNDPTYKDITFMYSNPATETVSPAGRVVWHCSPIASAKGASEPVEG